MLLFKFNMVNFLIIISTPQTSFFISFSTKLTKSFFRRFSQLINLDTISMSKYVKFPCS